MIEVFVVNAPRLQASTDTDILCLQVMMGLYGLAIPILLYYAWKYNKFRDAACIKTRRPNITIYVEFVILCMFINRIIYCANAIYYELKILRVIFILTYPITNHSVLWICLIKYWLLYYDIQFVLFSEGNQWKTHINRHNVTFHTNWYVLHKSTIGNEIWLLKKILIIILFPSIIIPFLTFLKYTNKYFNIISLLLMTPPLILITIIWYKTPKYLDYFRVREECRILVIIGSSLIILYLIFGLVTTFLLNEHSFFIVSLCIEYTYLLGVFICGLHLTFWTISKNKHRLHTNQQPSKLYLRYRSLNRRVSSKKIVINPTQTIRRRLSSLSGPSPNTTNEAILLLISILESDHGFRVFLSHLLTEFCLESALAIIEFTQYQILMKQIYGNKYDLSNELQILSLPHIIPQSIIVYDPNQEDGIFDTKNIAKQLLEKYIVNQCQFEINISYKLKRKLLNDLENMNNLNEMKLIHLFDEAIQSLLLLLNDSLGRFIKTAKYKQIEKELAQKYVHSQNNQNNRNIQNEDVKPNVKKIELNKIITMDYIKVETPNTTTMDSPNSPNTNAIILPSPTVDDINIDGDDNDNEIDEQQQEPIMILPSEIHQNDNNNKDDNVQAQANHEADFVPLEI